MDMEGFAKVLVDPKYGEILGVHIIGCTGCRQYSSGSSGFGIRSNDKRYVQYFICASNLYRSTKRSLYVGLRPAGNQYLKDRRSMHLLIFEMNISQVPNYPAILNAKQKNNSSKLK